MVGDSEDFFLKIFEKKNLAKELASYFGVTVSELGTSILDVLEDSRDVQTSVHDKQQQSGESPDNKIIFETGVGENKKRYVLPATPESYDFLKHLHYKT